MKASVAKLKTQLTMAKMETTSYKYKTSLMFSLNYAYVKTFIYLYT
jgi:hypothetical protein